MKNFVLMSLIPGIVGFTGLALSVSADAGNLGKNKTITVVESLHPDVANDHSGPVKHVTRNANGTLELVPASDAWGLANSFVDIFICDLGRRSSEPSGNIIHVSFEHRESAMAFKSLLEDNSTAEIRFEGKDCRFLNYGIPGCSISAVVTGTVRKIEFDENSIHLSWPGLNKKDVSISYYTHLVALWNLDLTGPGVLTP